MPQSYIISHDLTTSQGKDALMLTLVRQKHRTPLPTKCKYSRGFIKYQLSKIPGITIMGYVRWMIDG
jgi:hypothetical protein